MTKHDGMGQPDQHDGGRDRPQRGASAKLCKAFNDHRKQEEGNQTESDHNPGECGSVQQHDVGYGVPARHVHKC
jgi:hypothetical protein